MEWLGTDYMRIDIYYPLEEVKEGAMYILEAGGHIGYWRRKTKAIATTPIARSDRNQIPGHSSSSSTRYQTNCISRRGRGLALLSRPCWAWDPYTVCKAEAWDCHQGPINAQVRGIYSLEGSQAHLTGSIVAIIKRPIWPYYSWYIPDTGSL